jgi:transcriptional regulator with XRE-family HTH domain
VCIDRAYIVGMQKRKGSTGNTVGEMVRSARKRCRRSLRDVADACNKSHGFIADLELGRRNATSDVLRLIASYLDINPSQLIKASNAERIGRLEKRIAELRKESA